jgi:hypothetical protein
MDKAFIFVHAILPRLFAISFILSVRQCRSFDDYRIVAFAAPHFHVFQVLEPNSHALPAAAWQKLSEGFWHLDYLPLDANRLAQCVLRRLQYFCHS